jgi:AraC-like DNA-binding protein
LYGAVVVHRVSPASDDLSEALSAIRVKSVVFCRSAFTAPWGFHVEDTPIAKFHLLLTGRALLTLDGDGMSHPLAAGDLVVLPHGTGHRLHDRSASCAPELNQILIEHPVDARGRMWYGGGGDATAVICGGFGADAVPEELLAVLPRVLRFASADGSVSRWLEPLAALLADERETEPGDAAVLAKVADLFLTEFLRQYLASQQLAQVAAFASVEQPIGAALRMMREDPARPWTVTRLARSVGMSRTAFAARFHASVGEPPIAHLTRLRLNSGAGYLASTSRTIGDIAHEVGYDNEASFSKAFKRTYGQSPGAFRAEWTT